MTDDDDDYVALARQTGVGGVLEKIRAHTPVTFSDLEAIGEGIAHVTEYGFCVHDFSMLPCQRHRDCLNCTEQVCIKGDDEKLDRLKKQRDGIRLQLNKTQQASEDEVYGADRWSQHQLQTLEQAEKLIQLLESPDLEDGAIIKLSNDQEFSPLNRALASHTAQTKPSIPSPNQDMDELRSLLGG